jgi:hypothetical protein
MITDQQIDDAILAHASVRTLKVAMIIARVSKALGPTYSEDFHERVGERIEWLCDQGRLEGYGDLKLWRHSEVRLPPP